MVCMPGPVEKSDMFAFSGESGARQWENLALLWSAPWKAWWAVAFEALEPRNYRR